MLDTSDIVAVIPVLDLKRAKHFYEGVLGFTVTELEGAPPGNAMISGAHGTQALLYERGPSHAEHTIATFLVDDIESSVATLRDHGVTFEEYDIPEMGLKTVNGIATTGPVRGAWFKDSEGNILNLTEMKAESARRAA